MLTHPIVHIILASVVSAALAFFLYRKSKLKKPLKFLLGSLRFLSILLLLLLLFPINIQKSSFESIKTKLAVLLDNSASIPYLEGENAVEEVYNRLLASDLADQFELSFFSFGEDLQLLDQFSFDEKETKITQALESVQQMYRDSDAPIVLVTDGNQTSGRDYSYYASQLKQEVYPIVVGDTTQYPDLRIENIRVNRYSYLHNEFPVEIQSFLERVSQLTTELRILKDKQVVHRETLNFEEGNPSILTQVILPANQLGYQTYQVELEAITNEKNISNNKQEFAIEVLDSSGKIALVSTISHPDLGMLKRAIESRSFYEVEILKPEEALKKAQEFHLFVCYQPNSKFKDIIEHIEAQNQHVLYLTGYHTDWHYLNTAQKAFYKKPHSQPDAVQARLEPSFNSFLFEDVHFDLLPPLQVQFGLLEVNTAHEVVLNQYVMGQALGSPMLALYEEGNAKKAIWDASDLWKWRSQYYERNKNFNHFDSFIQNLVQYLFNKEKKYRFEVEYDQNEEIRAQYFDANYHLDTQASLQIRIKTRDSMVVEQTMLPTGIYQSFDLKDLEIGTYDFEIIEIKTNEKTVGEFNILAYNVEHNFTHANTQALGYLADRTGGDLHYIESLDQLIEHLKEKKNYQIKEHLVLKKEALISYPILLGLLLTLLSVEWFIRKYNALL